MTALLEVKNFSLTRNGHALLKNISLSIQSSELVWLIGPNGAGKTTLLRSVLDFLHGEAGEIRLKGRPLSDYSRRDAARALGYVPQATGFAIPFTCFQFVLMSRYAHFPRFSPPTKADEDVAKSSMEETETIELADRFMETLSGGERQRVFIAAALAQETEILLFDEPTACLDPRHHIDVLSFLARLNRNSGRTIVCATHDLNGPSFFGGRVVALDQGAVVFDGPAKTAISPEILSRVYGLPFRMADWPGHPGLKFAIPEIAR